MIFATRWLLKAARSTRLAGSHVLSKQRYIGTNKLALNAPYVAVAGCPNLRTNYDKLGLTV